MASGNCLKFKLIPLAGRLDKRRNVQTPTNDDMIDEGQHHSPRRKGNQTLVREEPSTSRIHVSTVGLN